jgi:PAS domain S-box-containing protein
MKISTQFIMTMFIFGFILIGISMSVIITNIMAQNATEQEAIAFDIAQGANELNYLANDYMIHQENQQLERWNSRFASFTDEVAKLQTNTPEQQVLVRNIQANTARLKDVFDSVVGALEISSPQQQDVLDVVLLRVSWSRMAVQSQGLVSDASRLSQSFGSQAHRLQRINIVAVITLVSVFGIYFILNYLSTQRRALKGLKRLQAGTAIIGSGNLDYKIEEKSEDEIGELSRAFNRMTTDLKTVTASKSELESEIEERKKAENALRQSEERYRNLFSSMSEGFAVHEIILDASGKPFDYRFLEMNDAFEKLTGLSRGNVIGKNVKAVLPDVEQYWIEDYGHVAVTGEPVHFENYAAGLGKWYEVYAYSPAKNQFATLFTDITVRKQAEEALRKMNEELEERVRIRTREVSNERQRLYSVLETLPVYVVLLDENYHVPFANKFFRERFGESNGKRCYEYLFNRSEVCENCESYKVMNTRAPHHWEWLGPDGRNYDIFDFPFHDTDGSFKIMEMGIDITEQKKAQDALVQAHEELELKVKERTAELEAANRELEAFSYSVSHDLRAPLRSMEGFSNALLEDYASKMDDQGRLYLKYVQESSQLMALLIDDLLELSRVTRSDMNYEDIDLSEVVMTISSQLEKLEPARKVDVKIQPGIMAYGDHNLLRLALENLIGNAWKFSSKEVSPLIEVGITSQKGKSVYFVRDNGVGFDMAYADKLFKPFQRLHKETEFSGTGIGLATVQRIIRRHGGEVWAESKVGEGATFYFTLE